MSNMVHQFSIMPNVKMPRSTFDRSHTVKSTFDSGYLIPFYVDEVLPGDSFTCRSNLFARLATPIVPVMDDVYLDTFFFSVPYRLVWDNWEKFIGGVESDYMNPELQEKHFTCPQISCPVNGYEHGSLSDYMGIPPRVPNCDVDAFWHRAYNLIWNEWFRRQFLQEPVAVPTDDGPDNPDTYRLLKRNKRHDYFTSALPFPQVGDGVTIPLAGTAPVGGNGRALGLVYNSSQGITIGGAMENTGDATAIIAATGALGKLENSVITNSSNVGVTPTNGAIISVANPGHGVNTGLIADLSQVSAVNINELRIAFQVQRLRERDAYGQRYREIILSHFGVVSPDARLQRPEFLGGKSSQIYFNSVPQTSSTDSETPQGNLAAFALTESGSHGFVKSFVEHCLVIGVVNVRAKLSYQQGLPKMFTRRTREEFYFPEFANLGEQAVKNGEIYFQGNEVDDQVFGYQERHAEYRYKPNMITGQMRSKRDIDTTPTEDPNFTSLDYWHMAQDFESCPNLNSAFIEDNPPIKRALAVQNEPEFLLDCFVGLKCTRPMPLYSMPSGLTRG